MYFVAFSDSLLFTVERIQIQIQYTQGGHKTGATILHTTEAAALENHLLYHNAFTLIQNDNSTRKSFYIYAHYQSTITAYAIQESNHRWKIKMKRTNDGCVPTH